MLDNRLPAILAVKPLPAPSRKSNTVIECISETIVDVRLAVVADYNSSRTAVRKPPFINVSDQFVSL